MSEGLFGYWWWTDDRCEHCEGTGIPIGQSTQRESGFYWFYTLDDGGNRLESTPNICWYRSDMNHVSLIGYDVSMDFDSSRYELIAKCALSTHAEQLVAHLSMSAKQGWIEKWAEEYERTGAAR